LFTVLRIVLRIILISSLRRRVMDTTGKWQLRLNTEGRVLFYTAIVVAAIWVGGLALHYLTPDAIKWLKAIVYVILTY
jgi:hypothetical protein